MTGTEKQVKWAEEIKSEFIKNANERIEYLIERGGRYALAGEKIKIELAEGLNMPVATSSTFWINFKIHKANPEAMINCLKRNSVQI